MTDQTAAFVPPAAENLPPGVLDSATDGASALDAGAREPAGRNFLAHALVRLARDGWLRTEPGEGFEVVRDRETPEPSPVGQAPATDRAAEVAKHVARAIFALKVPSPDGSQHYQSGWDDGLEAAMGAARDAVLAMLPAPADRAAVLAEVERVIRKEIRDCGYSLDAGCDYCNGVTTVLEKVRRMAAETQQPEPTPVALAALYRELAEEAAEWGGVITEHELRRKASIAARAAATLPAVEAQQPKEARS